MKWRTTLSLFAAMAALASAAPGDAAGGGDPSAAASMTRISYSSASLAESIDRLPGNRHDLRLAAGAECPVGSRKYCGDDLPWCCVAADGTAYCAKDTTGCTK